MSFPEAEMLLKDPTRLLQLLYSKYGYIDEDVEQLYINQILYNKKSHYDTLYKEYQYNDILEEFLRRFYTSNEAIPRIPKLANYYKNYHLFFCKPVLRDWRVHLMMSKYGDNKAEVFYKDNYGADTEMRNELEQNIESSLSEESLRVNNGKVSNNNNKTIFDKVTRKFIDNTNNAYKHKANDNKHKQMKCNQVNNNNNNSITLNLINDSKLNQTYGLISKRSNNNSFLDLMHSLNICNKIPSSMRNSLQNKNNANRSNSINNHLKQKVIKKNATNVNANTIKQTGNDMNNANNVNNKNTFNPNIKMNFNNTANKTKFAEFKQNNPMNNNNNTTHSKKNSHINASSNTHYNIIPSSHHKNKSYQQNSIGACNSINNLFHYKSSRLTRNNTKQLGYNLSLKKSNPISNLHSLSNNHNNNNSKGRNTKLNLIKSPQHSSVTTYYNMIFNMTHSTQTQKMKNDMKHNTKTFVVQKSQRSSSYKGNTNNNSIENKNSRNKRMFSQNASKTSTQSIKTFNKTRNIFTRSVENQKTKVSGLNKVSNNQRQINAVIGLLNKQNGYDDKKNTFNQHFHFLHNKQQHVNNNNNTKVQELKNKLNHKGSNNNTKGKIMFQTLNGFNIGLNRKLRAVQSKNKKV